MLKSVPLQCATAYERWVIVAKSLCLLSISRVNKLDFLYFAQEDFPVGVVVGIPVLMVFAIGHHGDGSADWAVLIGLVWAGKSFALDVGLHPEVGEEEEEEDAVHPDQVNPQGDLIVTLFHEVVLTDVNGDQDKLCL